MEMTFAEIALKKEIYGLSRYIEVFNYCINANRLTDFQIDVFDHLVTNVSSADNIEVLEINGPSYVMQSFLVNVNSKSIVSCFPTYSNFLGFSFTQYTWKTTPKNKIDEIISRMVKSKNDI